VFGHGPHTSSPFTGHGRHHLVGVFAASHQFSIACTHSPWGLPTDVLDGFGVGFQAPWPGSTHFGGVLIGPRAFNNSPTPMAVPGFRDRPLPASLATGIFGRHAAQALPQLAGRSDAREIAASGQRGDRHGALPPPQGLEGGDARLQPPGWALLVAFLLPTSETFSGFVDGSDVGLKGDLRRRGGTDHLAAPSEVGRTPGGPPGVPDVRPEPEGLETKLGRLEITEGVFTRAGEVADRVIFHLGHIGGRQITRAHQPRPWPGVAAVGFHAGARLVRNQGGGHDPTAVAFLGQIALAPIPTRARFIDQDEVFGRGVQCAEEIIDGDVPCADGAEGANVRVMIRRDVSHRDSVFMAIPPDVKRARLLPG
jgi:hypothetical protein